MISLITSTLTAQPSGRPASWRRTSGRRCAPAFCAPSPTTSGRADVHRGSTPPCWRTRASRPGAAEAAGKRREEANADPVVENLLSITAWTIRPHRQGAGAARSAGRGGPKVPPALSKVNVAVSVPEELVMVPMDPILIEQVLANLLENAAVHGGPPTSPLLEKEGACTRFAVRNDGRGIPKNELDSLFDGRLNPSAPGRRREAEHGPGLSVCRAIVLAHGEPSGPELPRGESSSLCPDAKEVPS